ncbi:sensor domain-containing protein [Mycolicibacterium arenosum]|uniref:Diguanylate cyclase n=1 Tax=Mycolicibacterium arenosum TaxID=2952157 RepID=A0ABT1M6T6_9MYCO|nr:diguanylate cyclase [Mycolicibacterium sp. CAU 1645]MCP9274851.1 diguanylate cyclase [Mycolicibacterium sp. CAU 1645]
MTVGDGDYEAEDVSATDDTSADLIAARSESADDRYQRLLEHSPDAICVHQGGRVVYVNKAGLRWMAVPPGEDLVGTVITQFVHASSIPAMLERIGSLRKQGDISEPSEAIMLTFDGREVDVEAVSVLTVWNGEPAYQVIFRDMTGHKVAQAALRFQAALVDHVSDAIIATTDAGLITSWNPAAEAIYHRSAPEVLGLPVSEAVGAQLDPAAVIAAGGRVSVAHRSADGVALSVRVSAAAMTDGYVLLCTDQSALRRAEQHFQTVVSSLEEGVVVLDHAGRLLSVNPAVARVLRLTEEDHRLSYVEVAQRWKLDPDAAQISGRPVLDTLTTGTPFSGEVYNDGPTGERRWLSISSRRLNPEDGRRSAVLITFHDITAVRTATERFAHLALHDPLTGLPNRAHLVAHLDRLLADGTLGAVLFVDLDDLKTINDSLGHDTGDEVIQLAGQRIRESVRRTDSAYRLAGDEFVVLMTGPLEGAALDEVTGRINAKLEEPMSVAGLTITVGGSIGVVDVRPDEARGGAALLRQADRAMYAAKARARRAATYVIDSDAGVDDQASPTPLTRRRS